MISVERDDDYLNNVDNGNGETSDSEVDSLTEEMDQIGKLNLNMPMTFNISSYMGNFSGLRGIDFPSITKIQAISKDITAYVSNYANAFSTSSFENRESIKSLVKTALSSRVLMEKLLNDLDLGMSISAAIEQLQPLNHIIRETIFLPADDESEDEEVEFNISSTEPGAVDEVINSHQAVVTQIVKPELEISLHKRSQKLIQDPQKDSMSEREEASSTFSDFDLDDDLSSEEVKVLTHLDSLEDFYDEDLLRQKIQNIRRLKNLTQDLKNKLVTKLMMGNYYRYVNEKLAEENKRLIPRPRKRTLTISAQQAHLHDIKQNISNGQADSSDFKKSEVVDLEGEKAQVRSKQDEEEGEDEGGEEVVLNDKDREPTYFDSPFNTVFGCQHYQRNCKIECSQCLKWYCCRFCHDAEISSHKLVRAHVRHVLCMHCKTPQIPKNNYCVSCEKELANYFCYSCKLYDNDANKDIYHCDKCGICRLGLGLGKDFFHCDTCNICLSIDLKERHKCLANTTHCNCPICNEYLFTSVNKVVFMKCGHLIHQSCYDELCKYSYKCPICKKTVADVDTQFRILDQEILQSPLPLPYSHWRCIISCNDCRGKSNAAYHVLGLKCKYCLSYNTNILRLIKPEEEEEEEPEEEESEFFEDGRDPMRLIKTNILSNFGIDEVNTHVTEEEYYPDSNSDDSTSCLDNEENSQNILNLKSLTNSIIGTRSHFVTGKDTSQSTVSSISAMLQTFINNSTSED